MKIQEIGFLFLFLITTSAGYAQIDYSLKVETGCIQFIYNSLDVDPGPDWKGYYLEDDDGMDISLINGIMYADRFFAGIGTGYSNFEGMDGLSVFADFDYLPLKTRLSPLLNAKFGYHHLWNQYENGTGTASGNLALGINFRVSRHFDIYAKGGIMLSQQAFLFPLRLGARF
ncbi:MAG: hypothetical protein ACOCZI_02005 [Marinilabiliaceae bacterium]